MAQIGKPATGARPGNYSAGGKLRTRETGTPHINKAQPGTDQERK